MAKFERKEKSQPKHKPTASSGASKAPRPPPVQQPGWKGPTYLHKKPARPKPPSSSSSPANSGPKLQAQALPVELQQLVLDIFRETFPASLDFEGLKPTLQEINAALADKDFSVAFGTEEFREAYAIRWSPSRALCYANLLADILSSKACDVPWVTDFLNGVRKGSPPHRAVCIGGGVSEIMAFGALLRHLKPEAAGKPSPGIAAAGGDRISRTSTTTTTMGVESQDDMLPPPATLDLTLVDTAHWASAVAKLEQGLKTPPTLSKYASAAARANNASLIGPETMRVVCTQADVLASSSSAASGGGGGVEHLEVLIGPNAALITLFFTLNDLYNISIPKTTKFLVEMSMAAPRDTLLLVADSVGACSEAAVSKTAGEKEGGKKYSMAWLIDHLLLDQGKTRGEEGEEVGSSGPAWEKLLGDECRMFRLEEGLKYPASLENMRFQVHLFRRL